MKRLVLILTLVLLVVAVSLAQQAQMTSVTTIAGDSVKLYQFRSVEYLPNGVIWLQAAPIAYTGANYVFVSSDNGVTWFKRLVYTNSGLGSPGISMITAKDQYNAFVATTTGEIFRTTNGGVKWDTVTKYSTPDVAFADGIKYVGQDSLVAYGDAADAQGVFVTRSFDGGNTWTRFTNFSNDSLKTNGIYAGSVSYGGAMEAYGKTAWLTLYNTANDPPSILKTTDGGTTWSWFRVTLPSGPANNYSILSLTFKDANVGFAVSRRAYASATTNSNYLTRTTDGGKTWSDTISVEPGKAHPDAKPMTVRGIRGTNTVIAVGFGSSGSKAWMSTDNGLTFSALNPPSPGSGSDLRNLAFGSATQGIMVGYQNIVRITLLTAVENEHSTIPTGFALEQNYPNPFNPTTKISYSVPKTSVVELKVYDLLGRTVATLVNSEQTVGTHTVSFDAKGLSSGVYLYTMKAGDFTATKSLLLIK
jgi:photosystem II stability/assembly factor-like uncharacterized protein